MFNAMKCKVNDVAMAEATPPPVSQTTPGIAAAIVINERSLIELVNVEILDLGQLVASLVSMT